MSDTHELREALEEEGLITAYLARYYWKELKVARETAKAALASPAQETAPAKPTLPVGVSVLITNGDSILLGERINNTASGLLSTPGGRVEQNEDIFATAVRETLEETGLSLTKELLRVVAWREHFRFGQHYIMFYVHAPQSFGVLENREPDKCKAWEWHKISEVRAGQTTEPLEILRSLTARAAFDARAFAEKLFGDKDIRDCEIELANAAYAAGQAAPATAQVTPEMVLTLDDGFNKPWNHLSSPLQRAQAKAQFLNALLRQAAPASEGR